MILAKRPRRYACHKTNIKPTPSCALDRRPALAVIYILLHSLPTPLISNSGNNDTDWIIHHPLHRYEFGQPKFFSKTCKFSVIYYSTWQISGGGQWRKAYRSRRKESKQSQITWKQSEPFRSISQIEKTSEFVRGPKNSFKWLYTLKGLLVFCRKSFILKRISVGISQRWRGSPTFRQIVFLKKRGLRLAKILQSHEWRVTTEIFSKRRKICPAWWHFWGCIQAWRPNLHEASSNNTILRDCFSQTSQPSQLTTNTEICTSSNIRLFGSGTLSGFRNWNRHRGSISRIGVVFN